MSFNKITQFGDLTLNNGQRVSFKDFDKNSDNIISNTEFQQTIKELELNDVDIQQIDLDGDEELSFDEFSRFEQLTLMQDYVNELEDSINRDFSGNAIGINQVRSALINFITEFSNNYGNNKISDMAKAFKKLLPEKYEELKTQFLNDDMKNSQTTIIDNIMFNYSKEVLSSYMPDKDLVDEFVETLTPKLRAALDNEALKYLSTCNESDVVKALSEHLNTWAQENFEQIINETKIEVLQAGNQKFMSIGGGNYTVNPSLIDYSFDSRYSSDGQIYERGKGWSGSKDKAYNEGLKLLNNESLKSQMKAQITKMLEGQGISFDKVATVFENVYNDCVVKTLNAEDMITGRGARGLSSKGKAYINVKTCVDTFIANFNSEIVKAIDGMNASNTDFDTYDLDYSVIGTGENGEDFNELYKQGKDVTTKKRGPDYYVKIASEIINKLKQQCLQKTKAMFEAKGLDFDEKAFDSIFENAKVEAIKVSVTGVKSNGGSWSAAGDDALTGVLGFGLGAVGTIAKGAIEKGWKGVWKGAAQGAVLGACASTGPVGWAVGGALVIGSAISSFFGASHPSSSTLNTKTLVDTFMQNFKSMIEQYLSA